MKTADMGPDEKELNDALGALARVDEEGAPSHVEEAVMRRWRSVRPGKAGWGRYVLARKPGLALAASSLILGLSIGGWWVGRDVEPLSSRPQPDTVIGEAAWHSYDMIPWLDPDPDSLHIVRLRVASETLRMQGYAVSDPDGDGTVDIEMVLGSDGMARSVLVTSAETPMH